MRSRAISVCTRETSQQRRRVACCRKQTMSNYAPARRAVYGEVYVYVGICVSYWRDRSGNQRHKQPLLFRPPHKSPAAQERSERGAALSGSLICDRSAAGAKASPRLVGQPKWGNCSWHEAPCADRWVCARSESWALSSKKNLLLLLSKKCYTCSWSSSKDYTNQKFHL